MSTQLKLMIAFALGVLFVLGWQWMMRLAAAMGKRAAERDMCKHDWAVKDGQDLIHMPGTPLFQCTKCGKVGLL